MQSSQLSQNNNKHISNVGEGLFIGSWLATKPEVLQKNNISVVVSIGGAKPIDTNIPNVQFMHIAVDDTPYNASNMLAALKSVLPYLREKININKKNCLIHCTLGISASVTVAVAYMMRYKKINLQSARECITKVRPQSCPNQGFCDLLEFCETYKY